MGILCTKYSGVDEQSHNFFTFDVYDEAVERKSVGTGFLSTSIARPEPLIEAEVAFPKQANFTLNEAGYQPHSLLTLSLHAVCRQLLQSKKPLPQTVPAEVLSLLLKALRDNDALNRKTISRFRRCCLQEVDLSGCSNAQNHWFRFLHQDTKLQLVVLNLNGGIDLTEDCFRSFDHMPKLRHANLTDCVYFGPDITKILASSPNLQQLSLSGVPQLQDLSLKHLQKLFNLRMLDISRCGQISPKGISHLALLSKLHTLSIECCPRMSDTVGYLLVKMKSLTALNMGSNDISDSCLRVVSKLHNLRKLKLVNCRKITEMGLNDLQHLRHLENLDLSHCFQIVGPLPKTWKEMRYLSVAQTSCGDQTIKELRHMQKLKVLNIDSCPVSYWGTKHLSELSNLEALNIADTDASNGCLEDFSKKLHNLKSLNLFGCTIQASGLFYISHFTSLRSLNLDTTGINDSQMRHLGSLVQLEHLDLFGARVTDRSMVYIQHLQNLKSLQICGGFLTDRCFSALSHLIRLKNLNLSQNRRLKGGNIDVLSSLANLEKLNLSNTKVLAEDLVSLSSITSLRVLILNECKFSDEEIRILKDTWPRLKCLKCG